MSHTDAEEVLRSTNAKANFQWLTRLLMCGGLRLLRETFDSIHSPAGLPLRLSDPTTQGQLRGARLSRPEWNCLYPSPGTYGKSTDCDITLLFRLLRTICNLTPPPGPRGWDNLPSSCDVSLEADLVRIKYYRNQVYGHKKTMEISDVEFVRLWEEIREALLRIAATISHAKRDEWKISIDNYLSDPLTPEEERCNEELNRWYMNDMDVKAEVQDLREDAKAEVQGLREDAKAGVEKLDAAIKELDKNTKRGHESTQEEVRHLREEVRQSPAPVYITGPVVIQMHVVNTVESIQVTQTGLPIVLNHPSGSPQFPQTVGGSGRSCAVPIHPDHEQPVGAEGYSEERQLNQQDPPTEIQIWNVILSFKESFLLFIKYLRYKLNVDVCSHDVGSLLITVECSSLQSLEGLWEDYRSGHLNLITQEVLVTADVLEKLGLTDIKLRTFISEEEYEKGKQIFDGNSGAAMSKAEKRRRKKLRKKLRSHGLDGGPEQSKVDSSAIQQRVTLTDPSIPKGSLTGESRRVTVRASSTKSAPSSQDYLQRISKLEKENVELRRKMEAIEQAFEGMKKAEKERLEFTRMVTQEKVELAKRVKASENVSQQPFSSELSQLKSELHDIRKMAKENRRDFEEFLEFLEDEEPIGFHHWTRLRGHYPKMPLSRLYGERKTGFCEIIINGQSSETLLKEEVAEVKRVFQGLGFNVVKEVCSPKNDIESVIKSVARRDYSHYSFVYFILSDVTESWEIQSFAGKSLSVSELIAKFTRSLKHSLRKKQNIFIIQGLQPSALIPTALDTEVPVDEKSITVQLPVGEENLLCLFVPYRKGYISTLLSTIENYDLSFDDYDFVDILSKAKKLFFKKTNITIPDPVHTISVL